jgi:hypothetical protein
VAYRSSGNVGHAGKRCQNRGGAPAGAGGEVAAIYKPLLLQEFSLQLEAGAADPTQNI